MEPLLQLDQGLWPHFLPQKGTIILAY